MKKIWIAMLSCALMLGALSASTVQVRLSEITPEWQELFATDELVIECEEGTEVPLQANISGGLLDITGLENAKVKINRPFFIKMSKEALLFSLDEKEWQSFTEFIHGTLSFGIAEPQEKVAFFLKADLQ